MPKEEFRDPLEGVVQASNNVVKSLEAFSQAATRLAHAYYDVEEICGDQEAMLQVAVTLLRRARMAGSDKFRPEFILEIDKFIEANENVDRSKS